MGGPSGLAQDKEHARRDPPGCTLRDAFQHAVHGYPSYLNNATRSRTGGLRRTKADYRDIEVSVLIQGGVSFPDATRLNLARASSDQPQALLLVHRDHWCSSHRDPLHRRPGREVKPGLSAVNVEIGDDVASAGPSNHRGDPFLES
jgi:hypothetical protein